MKSKSSVGPSSDAAEPISGTVGPASDPDLTPPGGALIDRLAESTRPGAPTAAQGARAPETRTPFDDDAETSHYERSDVWPTRATPVMTPARPLTPDPGRASSRTAWVIAPVVIVLLAAAVGLVWWRPWTSADTAAAGRTTVVLHSSPSGADVRIAGERVGVTPLRVVDVQPGLVRVELEAEGHQSISQELQLIRGRTNYLNVALPPAPTAHGAPRPVQASEARPSSARGHSRRRGDPGQDSSQDGRTRRRRRAHEDGREAAVTEREARRERRRQRRRATERERPRAESNPPGAESSAEAQPDGVEPAKAAPVAFELSAPPPAEPKPVEATHVELKTSTDQTLGQTASDRQPIPRLRTDPEYPRRAERYGQEGWVMVSYVIDDEGSVRGVDVVESEPRRVFDQAAVKAVRQWKYEPAIKNGKRVATKARAKLRFRLE